MTDFDARWRAAANANPRRCTYPEAVPGYRASNATQRRTGPAEGPGIGEPHIGSPWLTEPDDDAVSIGSGHGAMTVVWRRPDVPPADAPVTVDEIRQRHELFDSEAELRAAAGARFDAGVREFRMRERLITDIRTRYPGARGPIQRSEPATLATDDAVQALADATAKADQPRPWWDPRRWWTR